MALFEKNLQNLIIHYFGENNMPQIKIFFLDMPISNCQRNIYGRDLIEEKEQCEMESYQQLLREKHMLYLKEFISSKHRDKSLVFSTSPDFDTICAQFSALIKSTFF